MWNILPSLTSHWKNTEILWVIPVRAWSVNLSSNCEIFLSLLKRRLALAWSWLRIEHVSHYFFLYVYFMFDETDETANPTPDGTPVSDGSTDSPVIDTHSVHFSSSSLNEQPRPASPVKRAARSLSWDPSTMTQTRLQILSRVRSVRENIRSQISNSSPSSPSSRSMWLDVDESPLS